MYGLYSWVMGISGYLLAIYTVVVLFFGIGWVMNLQNLFQYDVETHKFLISLAGVAVFPIGAIAGWLW